jgi:hypothetical protein
MSEIKERPILFSAPMVRAILEGQKTVTRRSCKPQPSENAHTTSASGNPMGVWWETGKDIIRCPYGKPGDRLWVRETWTHAGNGDLGYLTYRATYPDCLPPDLENIPPASELRWRPSIHMFRCDSRILLEITDVRVERLQDISDEQALAEGIIPHVRGGWHWHPHDPANVDDWHQFGFKTPVWAFHDLWAGINGQENWDANPWVWVVEFKRVTP